MNTKLAIGIVVLVVVLAGGYWYWTSANPASAPVSATATTTSATEITGTPQKQVETGLVKKDTTASYKTAVSDSLPANTLGTGVARNPNDADVPAGIRAIAFLTADNPASFDGDPRTQLYVVYEMNTLSRAGLESIGSFDSSIAPLTVNDLKQMRVYAACGIGVLTPDQRQSAAGTNSPYNDSSKFPTVQQVLGMVGKTFTVPVSSQCVGQRMHIEARDSAGKDHVLIDVQAEG